MKTGRLATGLSLMMLSTTTTTLFLTTARRAAAFHVLPLPSSTSTSAAAAMRASTYSKKPSSSRSPVAASAYSGGGGGGGPRTSSRPRPPPSTSRREEDSEPVERIQRDYPHVVLRAGKARLFLEGNPLVYGEAVSEVVGDVDDGDFVEVVDHRGNLIGKGCYNRQSMYRVRLLWHAREKGETPYAESLEAMVARRVGTAWATRRALGLPNAETNCFRLINGEGDRLSGLAADIFDKVCVVSSSSLWCEKHKAAIVQGLDAVLGPSGIKTVWRRSEARLTQDGFVDESEEEKPLIDVKAEAQKEGAFVWVKEAGIKYKVYPELGQKTGYVSPTYLPMTSSQQLIPTALFSPIHPPLQVLLRPAAEPAAHSVLERREEGARPLYLHGRVCPKCRQGRGVGGGWGGQLGVGCGYRDRERGREWFGGRGDLCEERRAGVRAGAGGRRPARL